jgi:hypothetical protein
VGQFREARGDRRQTTTIVQRSRGHELIVCARVSSLLRSLQRVCELVDRFAVEPAGPGPQQIDERARTKHWHEELTPAILIHRPV